MKVLNTKLELQIKMDFKIQVNSLKDIALKSKLSINKNGKCVIPKNL